MKYSIQTTPEEQAALYGMVENIVKRVCQTALKMEKLRTQRRERTLQQTVADVKEAVLPHDEDEDNNDDMPRKVIRFDRQERPTGSDVGRGDDRDLPAREEAPLPAETFVDEKRLRIGRRAFDKLVRLWAQGFGVEGAEQPDRGEAMRTLANSPKAFLVLAYVRAAGGLTWAVNGSEEVAILCLSGEERERVVIDLAGNITQVASILFPDLSDLYEYKNIFAKSIEEDEDDGE